MNNLKIDGNILDLGSSKNINNVSNYLRSKKKFYANQIINDDDEFQIDLEQYPNKINEKFDNILLMNVLEHIKNYKNCLLNINDLLNENGNFYGSTPFIFYIHPSPNDYFRYTKQFLVETIGENNFYNVKVKTLGTGIFCVFYSLIFNITSKIPFLNIIIFPICILLDKFINIFSKNIKEIAPLGYFFSAKKSIKSA